MGPPPRQERPRHLAARRTLRHVQPAAARERRLHRAREPGSRLARPAPADRPHAGDYRGRDRVDRSRRAGKRARRPRRGARAVARRLAKPRHRALSRALLAALRLAGAGLRRVGGAQAQSECGQGLDQNRARPRDHAALPERARCGGGDLRAGLPLKRPVQRDEKAPVLDEGRRALENTLRGSRMKLSHLFVLSAAAVVPAGALGVDPQVDLRTNLGTIRIELYPAAAPKTVENFLQYVKDGHYNGTIFHRVIDGFMIQGGGFDGSYKQKPTRSPVQNEAKNGLKNDAGTVAMA